MGPRPPCSETNDNNQIHFGGPIFDGQGREVYFLACIDGFSNFSTLRHVTNAKDPDMVKKQSKYIPKYRVPRKISSDQSCCLKGNKIQHLSTRYNT